MPNKDTPFSYKIIAEDNTTEKSYNGEFVKSVIVKNVKFGYEKNGNSYQYQTTKELSGKYYIGFDQAKVKDNKIHLYLDIFKGVEIECTEFLEPELTSSSNAYEYRCNIDVTGITNKKEVIAELKLKEKSVGQLILTLFPENKIIQSVYFGYTTATAISSTEYIINADVNGTAKNVEINLALLENETPENTNRLIKIFKEGEEKAVLLDMTNKYQLAFQHKDLTVNDKETIILTIQYFEDKNNTTSPTKTYTLTIQDI